MENEVSDSLHSPRSGTLVINNAGKIDSEWAYMNYQECDGHLSWIIKVPIVCGQHGQPRMILHPAMVRIWPLPTDTMNTPGSIWKMRELM